MQMTTYVLCWRRPIKQNNNRTNHKITMGHFRGCRKQQSSMRKPGIPPARIPEITKSSLHGMTFTLTLWSKHRQSRVATKWWEKLPQWNRRVKHDLRWKWQRGYGTQGHTQSPLRTAFPIIILHQNCGCGNHHCASALAIRLHGMGDCTHHQCVVISVH